MCVYLLLHFSLVQSQVKRNEGTQKSILVKLVSKSTENSAKQREDSNFRKSLQCKSRSRFTSHLHYPSVAKTNRTAITIVVRRRKKRTDATISALMYS